jgi:hypothetical protein
MTMKKGLTAAAVAAVLTTPAYAVEVAVTGAVEVEASVVEDNISPAIDPTAPKNTSDIILATAAVAVEARINNRVSANVALLYEEDSAAFNGTDFGLDEATLTMLLGRSTALSAGRMYVPFGHFESYMISDPLTLELGEISETALMLSTEDRGVTASIYAFKGEVDEITTATAPDDDTLSYGASVGYASRTMWMGASYITNIAETDALQTEGQSVADGVAGMGAYLGMRVNNATIILEHVAASDDFANGDTLADGGAVVGNTEAPSASNMEIAFALRNGATFALAYQMTDEAQFLGLPETIMSAVYSVPVMQGSTIGLEYASIEDYSVADGGTGKDATAYTLQFAVEF